MLDYVGRVTLIRNVDIRITVGCTTAGTGNCPCMALVTNITAIIHMGRVTSGIGTALC